MRYVALACDYDGTLAAHGKVDDITVAALERLSVSGRKLILVTGRQLHDLLSVFPRPDLFDWIVAENGALLYRPADREMRLLGERPPEEFIRLLRQQKVDPVSVGEVIVATWTPHEIAVVEAIRTLGLGLQVVFNKGAVMVLPPNVNKGTGLVAALAELELSTHNVVGIGDAENDYAFLNLCECSVAVNNALAMLKEHADLVTRGDHGSGVVELIDKLVADDLSEIESRLRRHDIPLGISETGEEVRLPAYGVNVLLAGSSGGGKSTITTGLLERLAEHGYQFCLVDPEGDYDGLQPAISLGLGGRAPTVAEVLQVLEQVEDNARANLLDISMGDRPALFVDLLSRIQELRVRTGRPHWVVGDEAHHLLPASWAPAPLVVPREVQNLLLITVHPDRIAPAVLSSIDVLVVIGESPEQTMREFCRAVEQPMPTIPSGQLDQGEALVWFRRAETDPFRFQVLPPRETFLRHHRKYAVGSLGPDKSFYFRGPGEKLNLRAQNLELFIQLAEGVDNATWLYHLRRGDYSRWFREAIKDEELADEAAKIEQAYANVPDLSRALIREAIEKRYTARP
ncbi:MAG: HAD-IIB family hydrolase [Chloroflexota bacterium]|nr:MAG: HAD-IIB family hydrolase [Chloroflexota bacterium]